MSVFPVICREHESTTKTITTMKTRNNITTMPDCQQTMPEALLAAPKNPQPKLGDIAEELKIYLASTMPTRSAWDKGIKVLAEKLVDHAVKRRAERYLPNNRTSLNDIFLDMICHNGHVASYSELCMTDSEICSLLCPPSQQKKKKFGKLQPYGETTWNMILARGYKRAFEAILKALKARGILNGAPLAAAMIEPTVYSHLRYCSAATSYRQRGEAKNILRFTEKVAATKAEKRNTIEIELTLRQTRRGLEFSVIAAVWNQNMTDWTTGGQIIDSILKLARKSNFSTSALAVLEEINDLWKKHHLNSTHAGTEEQEKALEGFKGDYEACCNRLKELGLYEVQHEGKPYKYGHGWIYRPIPEEDLARIWNLLNI